MTTVVVGAGPAGLLFAIVARLRQKLSGADVDWRIVVVDKRTEYVRRHRLRIDPGPFREIASELDQPVMATLLAFLEEHDFAPAINVLERRLSEMAADLEVERDVLEFGAADVPDVPALRRWLADREYLAAEGDVTVVGADSVHSAVRDAVASESDQVEKTHEVVARLQVHGDAPRRLDPLEQYRLAKLLGSVLDYRVNSNGFAEVDLFLNAAEHASLDALGANPKRPVTLTPELVAELDAPLFGEVVQYFRRRGGEESVIVLQSTFRLEHRFVSPPAFVVGDRQIPVFLVGDAAVSLPFFRGMACLSRCADALARAHAALLESGDVSDAVGAYTDAVREIREDEVRVVEARGRLVDAAREFARVSAMLPFPMQSWLLSVPRDERQGRMNADVLLNGLIAAVGLVLALAPAAPFPVGLFDILAGVAAWIVHVLGGAAYFSARTWDPTPNRTLKNVWRVEIGLLLVNGPLFSLLLVVQLSALEIGYLLVAWFLMGLGFVVGLVIVRGVRDYFWRGLSPVVDDLMLR